MALPELLVEVKELAELDPDVLPGDELSELMVALHQVRTMLEAHHARVAAAWDAQRVWGADGARNGAVWMARHTRAPKSDYGGLLWLARQRRRFPLVYAAWEAGEITRAHVSRLVRAWSPRVDAEFCRDEALLVHHARTLRYDDFDRAVSYWSLRADPDGASETNEERRARRRVSLDETLNHTWSGSVLLDPVSGAVVATELRRLEQHLFDADWADAKRRLQRDPHSYELARTPDQRRADALVEMARRSAGAQPDATARPLFTVLLGAETFRWLCELANDGTVVTPDQLRGWADDARLEAILFDALGQRAIKVSRARTFTGALRRILDVRDRRCYHPTCDEPAEGCQGDHIHPWSKGGPTSQDNGRLACGHHNRLRNAPRPREPDDPPHDPPDDPPHHG